MGNAPTKEVRSASSSTSGSSPASTKGSSLLINSSLSRDFLGVGDKHSAVANYNQQKKKKEREKEKRRLEQDQIMALIVRYDENVDGGYLAPYGNYKYNLNYKNEIVHDLILKRKLAPFYTPLMDYDESWSNEELLQYLKRNLKLHASVNLEDLNDDEEDPDDHKIYQSANSVRRKENKIFRQRMKEQAIKLQKEEELRYVKDKKSQEHHPFRYSNIPSDDLLLRIYGESEECPICFLYYPKLMNLTRCCVQPICTECFVQMKRLDPHFRHDDEQGRESSTNKANDLENPEDLISEPVKCPFCAMEDFGVTYTSPEFKTGLGGGKLPLEYKEGHKHEVIEEGDETNEEELANPFRETKVRKISVTHRTGGESSITRHRRGSLPADAPSVVTIDMIRPDWEQRLLNARTKMARRSAAATALHATSLIMNNQRERGGRGHNGGRSQINGTTRREQVDIEEKMVEEAMRLSLLDEEERQMKERDRNQSNR